MSRKYIKVVVCIYLDMSTSQIRNNLLGIGTVYSVAKSLFNS